MKRTFSIVLAIAILMSISVFAVAESTDQWAKGL